MRGTWECRCGVQGDPASKVEPFTEWRLHSNLEHDTRISGEQLDAARFRDLVST